MFEIGTILNKENYTQAAIACNKAGDRHIEKQGEQYIIVANPPAPEPTAEEKVVALENKYGMNRWQREAILAEGSAYADYTKQKAKEIEDLAETLRTAGKVEETEEEGSGWKN